MNAWIAPMNNSSKGFQTARPIHESVGRDQGDDDGDHQDTREDVAEEPEGQRDRLGDLLDDVDRGQRGVGLGVVLEVAADAPGLDRVVVHEEDHDQRERQGQVDVAGRRGQEAGVATRDEGQPVADQDEEEDRHAQADEAPPLGADGGLGEVGHLLDQDLPEELQLAGDARASPCGASRGRGPARSPAAISVVHTTSR